MEQNEFWVHQWKAAFSAAVAIVAVLCASSVASNVMKTYGDLQAQEMKTVEAAALAQKAMFDSMRREAK